VEPQGRENAQIVLGHIEEFNPESGGAGGRSREGQNKGEWKENHEAEPHRVTFDGRSGGTISGSSRPIKRRRGMPEIKKRGEYRGTRIGCPGCPHHLGALRVGEKKRSLQVSQRSGWGSEKTKAPPSSLPNGIKEKKRGHGGAWS